MVAYSFKQQFIDPITSQTKMQTIRAERKRHARAGEQLQFYYAMRTRHCRLIGRAECRDVQPLRIDVTTSVIILDGSGRRLSRTAELDGFAKLDGFANWQAMREFWRQEHPDAPLFTGTLIRWKSFEAAPPVLTRHERFQPANIEQA